MANYIDYTETYLDGVLVDNIEHQGEFVLRVIYTITETTGNYNIRVQRLPGGGVAQSITFPNIPGTYYADFPWYVGYPDGNYTIRASIWDIQPGGNVEDDVYITSHVVGAVTPGTTDEPVERHTVTLEFYNPFNQNLGPII